MITPRRRQGDPCVSPIEPMVTGKYIFSCGSALLGATGVGNRGQKAAPTTERIAGTHA
jgi:hypothetical protein